MNRDDKSRYEITIKGENLFTIILNDNESIEEVTKIDFEVIRNMDIENRQIITQYYHNLKSIVNNKMVEADKKFIEFLLTELTILVPSVKFKYYDSIIEIDKMANDIEKFIHEDFDIIGKYPNIIINPNRKQKHESQKNKNLSNHKFEDVVGMDKIKDKLYDIIDQFKNEEKYKAWHIKPIRAILLYGSPGTGKTYISEALANEIDATFIQKNISDILQKYIGESEKQIKNLFEDAREREGKTVIFIDEIDSIAKKRNSSETSEARNSVLNELLSQMSSQNNEKIFLIFATNALNLLDSAFLRSGRVDFKIEVPLPDFNARKGILELYSNKRPLSEDVNLDEIAKDLSGRNCADVELVANEAARRALKAGKEYIEQIDFKEAFEEQVVGAPDKDRNFEELERKITAVHEVGHLLADKLICTHSTVKRISILPRGGMLGFVHSEDNSIDKYNSTKQEMLNELVSTLAGRAAEEVVFGKENITTGASSDICSANRYARDIVTKYGMDDEFGLIIPYERDVITEAKATKKVKEILDDSYELAKKLIADNIDLVNNIADVLLDREELDEDEINNLFSMLKNKNINLN